MPENHKLLHDRRAIVLLAEDSDNDIELTKIAFGKAEFAVDLHVVRDGEQCLAFLKRQQPFANAPTPDIVLLDLHMPRLGGLEVLHAVNSDDRLKDIPTIVLTTSSSEREIAQAYQSGCGGYLLKPVRFADFAKIIQGVEDYWFDLVTVPRR